WAIGIAVGLLIITFLANWYVNYRLKPKLEAQLKERIHTGTDGRYRLAYEQLSLSLLGGSASATDVRLVGDKNATYRVRIGSVRIGGIGVLRWFLTKKVHIGTIT